MIGDDRNKGILRWKAARIVQHAWSRLYCNIYGHFYRPMFTQRGAMSQYTCECCGELTPWMNKKEHHAFLLEFRPTWGDRGSDSQEYRKMGKLHKPPLERTIGEPEGGWVGGTYMVRIALRKSKDIHNAILHAPYLDEFDRPTGGNIWVPHLERNFRLKDLHYLEVVARDDEMSEFL